MEEHGRLAQLRKEIYKEVKAAQTGHSALGRTKDERLHRLLTYRWYVPLTTLVIVLTLLLTFCLPYFPIFYVGTFQPRTFFLRPVGSLQINVELPLHIRSTNWYPIHVNEMAIVAADISGDVLRPRSPPIAKALLQHYDVAANGETKVDVSSNITIDRSMDIIGVVNLGLQCLSRGYSNVSVTAVVKLKYIDYFYAPTLTAVTKSPCPIQVGPWLRANPSYLRVQAQARSAMAAGGQSWQNFVNQFYVQSSRRQLRSFIQSIFNVSDKMLQFWLKRAYTSVDG